MSRSTKGRTDPKHYRGRIYTRVLDISPSWWWSQSAIAGWAVTHGIRIDQPYKIKRNWFKKTIAISQRQGPPAARIYVAQCELP